MTTSFTLAQYADWVRNRLDDTAFDGAIMKQFANDTNREICHISEWPFMETTFNGTVTQGQQWYDLPTDLETALNLTLVSPTNRAIPLTYMDYREVDAQFPNGSSQTQHTPWLWASFGGDFFIGPYPPDQGYTLQLRYILTPTTLSVDGNTFNVPDAFSEAVVLGMYRRALRYNDEFDQAQLVDIDFAAAIALMKQRLLPRQTGQNRRVNTGRTNTWYD